jgi:hypothetical protein
MRLRQLATAALDLLSQGVELGAIFLLVIFLPVVLLQSIFPQVELYSIPGNT